MRKRRKVLYAYHQSLTERIPRLHGLAQIRALADRRKFEVLSFEQTDRKQNKSERELFKATRFWLSEAGVPHTRLPFLSSRWLDIPMGAFVILFRVLFRGVRIVHCRSYIPAIMGLLVRCVFPIKLLFDMRGLFVDEYVFAGALRKGSTKLAFARWLERRLLFTSDCIVVVSEVFRDHLLSRPDLADNIDTDRILTIPNRVEISRFSIPDAKRLRLKTERGWDSRIVATYIGSSVGWHRLDQLMKIMSHVMKMRENLYLVIATYPSTKRAQEYARAIGIPLDRMDFLTVSVADIPELLSLSDLGLMFEDKHLHRKVCAPIKFSEYMAAGLPVIAGGGLGDVSSWVENNKLGVIVDPDRPEEAAMLSANFLSSDDYRAGMTRKRCLSFASREMDMKKTLNEYDQAYCRLDPR